MGLSRSALLWASQNAWLAERLPRYGFARRAVRRFMPGETLEAALVAADGLRQSGAGTVVTLLGEEVTDAAAAERVAAHYRDAAHRILAHGLDVELSVKPTHLGIGVVPAVTEATIAELARSAEAQSRKLWIDMEGSAWTDATLDLARRAREASTAIGVCLQANLRRTEADLVALLPLDLSIRLVKGAYLEPASIAFDRKSDVDTSFTRLAHRMLEHASSSAADGDGTAPRYAFGTHDEAIIDALRADGMARAPRCEIQMLYGIRPAAQRRLIAAGVPLRVLISYGDAWFAWYMRRLAERPANVGFLLRSLVAR